MWKNRPGKGSRVVGTVAVLDRKVQEGLIEQVNSEKRLEERKGMSHEKIWNQCNGIRWEHAWYVTTSRGRGQTGLRGLSMGKGKK